MISGLRRMGHGVAALLICISAARAGDAPSAAASCSGCHPAKLAVDTPVPRLAGQDAAAMTAALQAYRGGRRSGTVMDRIAKGFSDDEIKAIAAWFSAQP
jgi:cytochrome subunit of sulfide dehydrogenase